MDSVIFYYSFEYGDEEIEVALRGEFTDPDPSVGWEGGLELWTIEEVPLNWPGTMKELDDFLSTKEHDGLITEAAFEARAEAV